MNPEFLRIRAEVDLDAVLYNFNELTKERKDLKAFAVLKADAYGHGAVRLARLLRDRAYGFAVATAEEAIEIRDAGLMNPILILGPVPTESYQDLVRREIRIALFDAERAKVLSAAAKAVGKSAYVHIKVDTGMSRVGLAPNETGLAELMKIAAFPNLILEGLFTHFATMDMPDESHALAQAVRFKGLLNLAEKAGIRFPIVHLSNSAAVLRKKLFPAETAVRLGIALYGVYPSDDVRYPIPLKPVMSLKSRITYVKTIPAGTPVSYGETFVSKRPMRIATISAGYADGIARGLSNTGEVLIRGKRAKILGRVCMDQFMADVTGIPEAQEEDEVVLLGKQGGEEIRIEELSAWSGRFPYEYLTCISKRVPRLYVGGQ
ncbi:MAG: alanine racemase [Lachnospiraceae bacterium]|nr:alanine racemase [Lachnospiraceae bacterium]